MKLSISEIEEEANKKAHFLFLSENLNSCLLLCRQLCVLQLQHLSNKTLLNLAFCFGSCICVISKLLTQTSAASTPSRRGAW